MKSYSLRLMLAFFTFVTGMLAVTTWYLISPNHQSQPIACAKKSSQIACGDSIKQTSNRVLLPVIKDSKYGFINERGEMVIDARYDYAQRFSEGLAVVMVDGKVGYIDLDGNYAIKPQFAGCCTNSFSEGLAVVKLSNEDKVWSYIDQTGQLVFQVEADYVDSFSEGLAATIKNKKWRYIDKQGKVVLDLPYRTPDYFPMRFGNGLTRVKIGSKWGYVDQQGKLAIAAIYDQAENFSEGLAVVTLGKRRVYIDTIGNIALAPNYEVIGNFSNGLAMVSSKKKTGYIDRNGKLIISEDFVMTGDFHDGFAGATLGTVEVHNSRCCGVMRINGKRGFIDKTGKMIWYYDTETKQYSN